MREIFVEPPTLAFKRNKNLRDMIGGNKTFDNKTKLNVKKFNKGKLDQVIHVLKNLAL